MALAPVRSQAASGYPDRPITIIVPAPRAASVLVWSDCSCFRRLAGFRLDRVDAVVKMLCAVPDFRDHPKVAKGMSDLFVEVFGDPGKHARSAVCSLEASKSDDPVE